MYKYLSMKKFFFALFVFVTSGLFAQTTFRFGVKAGADYSLTTLQVPSNVDTKTSPKVGFWGGGFVEMSPNSEKNKFKLQLEALYNANNFTISNTGYDDYKDHLDYLSFPLLAKYFIKPDFSLNAGPVFNLLMGATQSQYDANTSTTITNNIDDQLKSFQMGLAVGATYYIYQGLFVDLRYNPFLGQANKSATTLYNKLTPSALTLGIGYKF